MPRTSRRGTGPRPAAQAADAIAAHFAGTPISFVFNNAGIGGIDGYVGGVLGGLLFLTGNRKLREQKCR